MSVKFNFEIKINNIEMKRRNLIKSSLGSIAFLGMGSSLLNSATQKNE